MKKFDGEWLMSIESAFIDFYRTQRNVFGICPRCGELFRLSDIKISYGRKFALDWYDRLLKKDENTAEKEEELEERLRSIREKAVDRARKVQLPRLLGKVDPLFTPLGYYPQDVKAVFDPVDFVVFDGMNRDERVRKVVFMDQQTEDVERQAIQKSIEAAIRKGKYGWETIRLTRAGKRLSAD